MSRQTVLPGAPLSGIAELPGDKSISHRYAILAALAHGSSEIDNFSPGEDCASTLGCLRRLGVQMAVKPGHVVIHGAGPESWKPSRRALDAGNSGATMRLLAGALAPCPFRSTLTGDATLRRRPMRRVVEPLIRMGASIEARDGEFAPLAIHGRELHAIEHSMPVASAQVKSALLLAALFATGRTTLVEPVATRDHMEIALREFGVPVVTDRRTVHIDGRGALKGRSLWVPGDISSAAFFLAATLIVPGSQLLLRNVGLNPTRTALLDVLASWGAPVRISAVDTRAGELYGDLSIHHGPLEGGLISGPRAARLIDELPVLAALGPFTESGVEIRDAAELRVKESDRIAVLAENLRHMGAQVQEFPDGLRVAGRSAGVLRGARLDPAGDHRIAMALTVAALGAGAQSTLYGAECAAVSFPGFFTLLEKLRDGKN
jgi:3-phosphoshikimate 1-carboxyvinyltransferase